MSCPRTGSTRRGAVRRGVPTPMRIGERASENLKYFSTGVITTTRSGPSPGPTLPSVQPERSDGRPMTMTRRQPLLQILVVLCAVGAVQAQRPDAAQTRRSAGRPSSMRQLVEVLELKPGMTVADVGSGFGAMTVVLGHSIGSGRVFATDITDMRCGKRARREEGRVDERDRDRRRRGSYESARRVLRCDFPPGTSITTSRQSMRSTGAWSGR